MAREREGDGGAQPFSGMKKGVRAESVRMAQLMCGFGSTIVRFGSTNVMSYNSYIEDTYLKVLE